MRQCTDEMQMGFTERRARTERQQDHGQETVERGMGLFQIRRLKYKNMGPGTEDLERTEDKDFNYFSREGLKNKKVT